MTPNFALNLSEDGIVLLHRAPSGGGWFREGRVDFASDDIAEGLARLRAKAVELEGEDFQTKLILPPSQLLFTTVDAETDIGTALEERTPYRADQLSYDTSGEGDQIRVVAVALETLGEAEGFITPHGLNPVGFTAIPEDGQYDGEPMLGSTLLGGDGFEADTAPVKIIEKPTFLPNPVAPKAGAQEENAVQEDAVDTAPKAEPEATPDVGPADTSETQASPDAPSDEPEPVDEAEPDPIPDEVTSAAAALAAAVAASAPTAEETPKPASFSSRRQGTDDTSGAETGERITKLAPRIAVPNTAPKLGGAPPKTPDAAAAAPAPKVKSIAPVKAEPKPVPVVPPVSSLRAKTVPPAAVAQQLAKAKPDPIAALAAKEQRGKPRFLGLVLTAILLICLGLAAVLSSYVLPDNTVSRLLGRDTPEVSTAAIDDNVDPELIEGDEAALPFDTEPEFANLPVAPPNPDFTTSPGIEQPPAAVPEVVTRPEPITETEAQTAYAATGIWQHARTLTLEGAAPQSLDTLYIASLDPDPKFEDAPALLPQTAGGGEVEMIAFTPVPPPGVIFDIDERGLVVATPDGALNPNGIIVYLGAPAVRAIPRPSVEDDGPAVDATAEPEAAAEPINPLAAFRPTARPENLVETRERATLGGLSRPELAGIRPVERPASAQAQAEAIARAIAEAEADTQAEAEAALVAATAQAVDRSLRAQPRPANFNRVVARATPRTPTTSNSDSAQVQTASASTAAPSRGSGPAVARASRVNPTGPVSRTVARAATDNNAIALGRVSLVGVFGTSSNRRALVRMPNGRFKKVSVGDRVDGGRVAAIDSGSLRYTKGGRTVTLQMPKG